MIYGITYSDENMTISAKKCEESMLKYGVDEAEILTSDDLGCYDSTDSFQRLNSEILKEKRGCGYWLWKPFIIADKMYFLKDGDILIYSDAGIEFVNDVTSQMDEDIFFFTNGFPHVEWCKGDVLNSILQWKIINCGSGIEKWNGNHNLTQVQASVIFFRVNQKTKDFVKEWLLYCQMPGFIDDSPSKLPNYPTFAEHRHDQAILTCLQIKYGYKLHFWPTNYSEHIRHTARPEDTYPTMFNHHRKRNNEW